MDIQLLMPGQYCAHLLTSSGKTLKPNEEGEYVEKFLHRASSLSLEAKPSYSIILNGSSKLRAGVRNLISEISDGQVKQRLSKEDLIGNSSTVKFDESRILELQNMSVAYIKKALLLLAKEGYSLLDKKHSLHSSESFLSSQRSLEKLKNEGTFSTIFKLVSSILAINPLELKALLDASSVPPTEISKHGYSIFGDLVPSSRELGYSGGILNDKVAQGAFLGDYGRDRNRDQDSVSSRSASGCFIPIPAIKRSYIY